MGALGMILAAVGGIGMLVFAIQMLILAFKKSVGWGIGSLILFPILLVFVFQNWPACKTPFLRWLGALVVWVIGFGIMTMGAVSQAGSEMMLGT